MISVGKLKDICEKIEKEYGSDTSVIVQNRSDLLPNGLIGEYALSVGWDDAGTLFIMGFKDEDTKEGEL